MPTPILNQIPKLVPGQLDAASNLLDDGVVLTYSDVPLMPIIQAFQATNSSALAAGSTTLTNSPLTISLPVGTYFVKGVMCATAPALGTDSYGVQIALASTGSITESSETMYVKITGFSGTASQEYGDIIGTAMDNNVASVDGLPDLSIKFETKVVVTVAGSLTVQVAQATASAPNAGIFVNKGSYLFAQRVA